MLQMSSSPQEPPEFLKRGLSKLRGGAYLFDPKFTRNKSRYFLQCFLVACTMFVVLLVLDAFSQTVLIAALGASSFIAFAQPTMRASRPRCLIGGYIVGVVVGSALSLMAGDAGDMWFLGEHATRIVLGAIAVGSAMFVMVTTNTEHPPAAALALGFLLNEWNLTTVAVVLAGIVAICVVKELCRKSLIDLL
jgi:CBS-domain-containing membrane protein